MVNLGCIKDVEQSPADYHRVFVRSAALSGRGLDTTVYSRPDRHKVQRYELAVDVASGDRSLDIWVPALAGILQNMGWTRWWLDSFSISMVLDRYITEALKQWGYLFWQHYTLESVVLVQVGLQRESVLTAISAWEGRFKSVRFAEEYDYEAMAREQANQNRERVNKFKSLLTPKFLSSKHRAI